MVEVMRGNSFKALFVTAVLAIVAFNVDTSAAATSEKPNIVVILADDLGYGDVGCYGATKVKTPNVDRLAREGIRFTDGHATSSTCTPSRYGLLTGEYPCARREPGFCRAMPR